MAAPKGVLQERMLMEAYIGSVGDLSRICGNTKDDSRIRGNTIDDGMWLLS